MSTATVVVRPAAPGDLAGIVQVEEAAWKEEVGADAVAPPELIRDRIDLCNGSPPGWFWVAEQEERVVASFVLQPTRMPPDKCVSWAQATDDGNLIGTFDPQGPFVYGVSLSVPAAAPDGTADLLAHAIHALRLVTGKNTLYACLRMSGFDRARGHAGVSPEEYWRLRRRDRLPRDPSLRLFRTVIGLQPVRLLPNGFPPDAKSGGHGVLCVSTNPLRDILGSSRRLYAANPSRPEQRKGR